MSIYTANFEKFGVSLIPVKIRKAIMDAYIKSILNPLKETQQQLLVTFRAQAIDEAKRNAQTIMLEDRLNSTYGTTGIYIETFTANLDINFFYNTNEVTPPPVYYFNESESPTGDDIIYMYNTVEYEPTNNFTVYIPTADVTADPDLPAKVSDFVLKYKVAGTTYNITTY